MIEALDILPQRDPIVMIDYLQEYKEDMVTTSFTVREDNIFVKDGALQESGIMEHIAQSCAARTGYISKYILHKPVDIGYIGQIKSLKIYSLPKVGDNLWTTIYVQSELFGITLIKAEVKVGDTLIAEGGMKLATKKED